MSFPLVLLLGTTCHHLVLDAMWTMTQRMDVQETLLYQICTLESLKQEGDLDTGRSRLLNIHLAKVRLIIAISQSAVL